MLCCYWALNDPYRCMLLLMIKWSIFLCTLQQCCTLGQKPQHCPSVEASWYPLYTWFLVPARVSLPNSIWISSAVFVGHICVTNAQTDRQTTLRATSVATDHTLCTACMRCSLQVTSCFLRLSLNGSPTALATEPRPFLSYHMEHIDEIKHLANHLSKVK